MDSRTFSKHVTFAPDLVHVCGAIMAVQSCTSTGSGALSPGSFDECTSSLLISRAVKGADSVPAAIHNPRPRKRAGSAQTYEIEFIDDSGAGRTILSQRALADQGVPGHQVQTYTGRASQPITFDTGGGERTSDRSIGMTGGLLQGTEAYVLEDSPIAVSMGQLVNQHKMPFIWLPGQLPCM